MELNFDDYKVKAIFPFKKDFIYTTTETIEEIDEAGLKYTTTTTSTKTDVGAYEKAKTDYAEESRKKAELFVQDFFKYHGIENKPWRDLAFEQAWSRGHSSGHAEVINCGHDIVYFCEKLEERIVNAINIPQICV